MTTFCCKQVGWLSVAFSYDRPLSSAISLRNTISHYTSPPMVSAQGFNFGVYDSSMAARWGMTATQLTDWVSNTALSVRPVRGLSSSWALAVSVGSGGLACPDPLDPTVLTTLDWERMTEGERNAYTQRYQRGCDRLILDSRTVHFQQVATQTAAMSFDAPVLHRTSSLFWSMPSNLAKRVSTLLYVTSEYQPPWTERRINNCTTNLSICEATNCTANVTGNCTSWLAFDSSWDNTTHATPFGPRPLTWANHSRSPGQVVERRPFRFNAMWNQLLGASFGTYDTTAATAIGHSMAEATVWSSDTAAASLAVVPSRGRSLPVAVTVNMQAGTQSMTASYDAPQVR